MGFREWLFGSPELPEVPAESRTLTADSVPWAEHVPFNMVPTFPGGSPSPATALALAPVYSANRLLAQSLSTLPVKSYRRGTDGTRVPMDTLPQLFAQLVTDGQLVPWLHRCVTSLGLRGNALGLIVARDGFGFPTAIEWLDPGLVVPDDRQGKTGWLVNGREVDRGDIVHIPLFTMPGQRMGLSPIASFAKTLGIGLQAENYAYDWFAGGGFPPGVFENVEKVVGQDEAEAIKARLVSAIRTHTPLVHGADWKYHPISVPPEEAQFVQTMKATTNEIAAIYGLPPEMIGGESGSSMTYASVEQRQINFTTMALRPWVVLLETSFSALLPDRQYIKLNSDALIRADLKTRWEVNKLRLDLGAASIDEIRTQEDQAPLPNGQGQQYVAAVQPAAVNPGNVLPMRRANHE